MQAHTGRLKFYKGSQAEQWEGPASKGHLPSANSKIFLLPNCKCECLRPASATQQLPATLLLAQQCSCSVASSGYTPWSEGRVNPASAWRETCCAASASACRQQVKVTAQQIYSLHCKYL